MQKQATKYMMINTPNEFQRLYYFLMTIVAKLRKWYLLRKKLLIPAPTTYIMTSRSVNVEHLNRYT